ncbi:MAG: hypothetical protein A2161_02420 [Candidatus Schekmanbacteria bacterium RBG_13_48_7]|uniref:Uncharacterized protein n=1 Tax=Candidatus Schekmanbacteria bacterium RBG_13_48_7 TaxID=1817878 RepID=A0A1F7RYE3_9BACT|nr:MAG: hypothetical protein A2161_02420 [Candidatus Schekmanbacteria bacterium RBG_13_48_7]
MEIIDQFLVEETWQEIAMYHAQKMISEGKRMAKLRPDLVGFMVEFSKDLSQDARELAMYIAYVIFRIFEKAGNGSKALSPEKIVKIYDENLDWIEKMTVIDDRFLARRIENQKEFHEKYVFQYVLQTLFENDDDSEDLYIGSEDDEPEISDEEKGYIFILLKTVIDSFSNMEEKSFDSA